jgi:tetratricopeptide (TPR) repeat protein
MAAARKLKKLTGSPQIYTYLRKYQADPTSRVFAPLAEAYRKAGLVDEAIEIAREGLRVHPSFVGGRVALSRALFDKQLYADVVKELKQILEDVPDNLVAQRLTAESQLMLGNVPDALSSYKMLLYFNPHDSETAKIVWELESQLYENGEVLVRKSPEDEEFEAKPSSKDTLAGFEVRPAADAFGDDPSLKRQAWVNRIEYLQGMLQRVERYRRQVS